MADKISVIIPTLNEPTLVRALAALAAQTRKADEIIVIGKYAEENCARFPEVRYIDTGFPVWPSAARNQGIREASGDILAFTDSDCIPSIDWLQRLEEAHAKGVPVVGGGVLLGGSNYLAQSDNISMFHEFLTTRNCGNRPYIPTLNLSIRRVVIETVGGMDETLRTAEDMDWSIRMRRAGFALFFAPSAQVAHAPDRTRWADVVRHWQVTGFNSIRVRIRYSQEFYTPRIALHPIFFRLLSPIIALHVTIKIFLSPASWRYLLGFPIVYATKVIYCLAAARALENPMTFSTSSDFPSFSQWPR